VTHDDLEIRGGTKRASASLRAGSCLGGRSQEWSLRLTAISADQPERLVRFLTGAVLACGGWVLTRTTQGSQAQPNPSAELDFEFARASCVEIYAVLLAAGLELSRDSHLQLADLCHCTKNLIHTRAFDIARVEIVVYHSASKLGRDDYELALAS
jgi:hypothetical protein